MTWSIVFSKSASKQTKKLNKKTLFILDLLVMDLMTKGPSPGKKWPNYSKLKGQNADYRHCHLSKGSPTYVCCWEIVDKTIKLIEVYYVGTHEKAPY